MIVWCRECQARMEETTHPVTVCAYCNSRDLERPMKTLKMELLKVGKDSQGDEFTEKALQYIVDNFKPGVPVGIGFDPTKPPVGKVVHLELECGVLTAEIEVDQAGVEAASSGMELAAGGVFDINQKGGVIDKLDFTGAALTDKKVK